MRQNLKTIWLALLLVLVLAGCKHIEYVPVMHTELKTHMERDTIRDSIYVDNSVSYRVAGDTVYRDKVTTVYRDRWRVRIQGDTIKVRDSVRVPVPVEKELSNWERAQLHTGGVVIRLMALGMVVALIYLLWKLRKWARGSI